MKNLSLAALMAGVLFSTCGFAAPVNINTAPASAIADALSGIGQRKAEAIVEYRQLNGKFKEPGDILQVKGIGAATFEKNRSDILVE